MSTQINIQKILAFNSFAEFPLTGLEGYIYLDNLGNIGYLWDSVALQYVNIGGTDEPLPPDPAPLTFVDAATVGVLSFNPVYNNGTGGVGATLTASSPGILRDTSGTGKIDSSYIPVLGALILVKNQASQLQNGIYVVTTLGSPNPGGTNYVLTRATTADQSSELYPLQVNVLQGTVNANQYFNQATSSPVVGTSDLVFNPASYQNTTGQIAFVDVATSGALPTCVYANGTTNPSYPGLNATLTASAAGSVLTIDGLTAATSTNALGTFNRVLVKNQVNPAHNGDYIVVNPGSATEKWQLRRINYAANGFFRFNRYFMVSNTQSTFAGKIFITSPNATPLSNLTVGTAAINIVEYGGSALIIGTTPITSGTIGRLIFQGTGNVLQQDSNLFWDNTNKRLGIGATPSTSVRLDVRAQGALSTDIAFRVRNSADTANIVSINGIGDILLGANSSTTSGTGGNGTVIAIGENSAVYSGFTKSPIAIGKNSVSTGNAIAIGNGASNGIGSTISANIAIGENAVNLNTTVNCISIGSSVQTGQTANTIAIGGSINFSNYLGGGNIAVGYNFNGGNFISDAYALGRASSATTLDLANSFSVYINRTTRSFFVNQNSNLVFRTNNTLTSGTHFDASATNTFTVHNGVAPATNITDAFQQYSKDIIAGNAAPHFRTENGDIIKLYKQTLPAVPVLTDVIALLTNLGLI